jgi:hypothetical protein
MLLSANELSLALERIAFLEGRSEQAGAEHGLALERLAELRTDYSQLQSQLEDVLRNNHTQDTTREQELRRLRDEVDNARALGPANSPGKD